MFSVHLVPLLLETGLSDMIAYHNITICSYRAVGNLYNSHLLLTHESLKAQWTFYSALKRQNVHNLVNFYH